MSDPKVEDIEKHVGEVVIDMFYARKAYQRFLELDEPHSLFPNVKVPR